MKSVPASPRFNRIARYARRLAHFDREVISRHVQDRKSDMALLDKAAKKNFTGLSDPESARLEAIVSKVGRPVLLVRNGDVDPAGAEGQWPGRISDSRDVIKAVLPAVGRIEMRGAALNLAGTEFSDQMIGTGFVVGRNLIVTNRHVAEVFCREDGTVRNDLEPRIDFVEEYQRDPDEEFRILRALEIGNDYDYAILEVDGGAAFPRPLSLSGGSPDSKNTMIFAVGYPAFDSRNPTDIQKDIFGGLFEVKRLAPGRLRRFVQDGQLTLLEGDYTTLGGNSGSPLFDFETGDVVALHFSGAYLEGNYSVPMSVLKPRIEAAVRKLQGESRINTQPDCRDLLRRVAALESLFAHTRDRSLAPGNKQLLLTEPAALTNTVAAAGVRGILANTYEDGDTTKVPRTKKLSDWGLDAPSKRAWEGPLEGAFSAYSTNVDADLLAAAVQVEDFITAVYVGSPNRA